MRTPPERTFSRSSRQNDRVLSPPRRVTDAPSRWYALGSPISQSSRNWDGVI